MDRREYLKTLTAGTLGAGLLFQCQPEKKDTNVTSGTPNELSYDRTPEELKRDSELIAGRFFNDHEMKTIATLADIIIPADEKSGSATDAGVPDFINFIVLDMPHYQTPIRGGIRWLDLQCMRRFNADFVSCTHEQQIEMVDEIAWPEKARPEMQQGVAFFNIMRDLTACGFFSSQMGIEDIGYMGNRPNQWDGVPQDVLDQYGLSHDPRLLDLYVRYDT
jgi:gluconate 2-dehydrogenase gamma chain